MPVDSRQLQKPEHENFDVMVEDTLCQETAIEIGCLDEGIPDFDLLDEIDQQSSKWMQSCERLITVQTQTDTSVACIRVLVNISTDCVRARTIMDQRNRTNADQRASCLGKCRLTAVTAT